MQTRLWDSDFVTAARTLCDGSALLQVDADASVRRAAHGGSYVQAWLWVTDELAERHAGTRGPAPQAGVHQPATPGPWGVASYGRGWYIVHAGSGRRRFVGNANSRTVNYFYRALELADQRNRELRAKQHD